MIDGVHPGDVRQECLSGADVGGGLLPANVLFARLQRHAIGHVAVRIHGHADDSPRRLADELLARGEIRRVRPTVAHRYAESLCASHSHVGACLAGGRCHSQAQEIRRDGHQHAGAMCLGDEFAEVDERAMIVRRLHERTVDIWTEFRSVRIAHAERDAERLCASHQHFQRLRKDIARHPERVARCRRLLGLHTMQQRHRFRSGRRLVQERRRGNLHRGQIADRGLKVQQRFKAPLRDFGLIRRIRRIPGRVFEKIPENDAGRNCAVVPHSDERLHALVLGGHRAQAVEVFVLALRRRQPQRRVQPDARGKRRVDQRIERWHADHPKHLGKLLFVRADVTLFESVRQLVGHEARYFTNSAY